MVIGGDSLFIAINNAFAFGNEQGMIGILDLNNISLMLISEPRRVLI